MTLSMAWVRTVGSVSELVFASDSRLRGGHAWDCCPKIYALPRSDCLISFAGSTSFAYPLMIQMAHGISFFPASNDRRTDITAAKRIALDVFNQMRDLLHDFPTGQFGPGDPEVGFIFGGYSWKTGHFHIWSLHYDTSIDRFTFRPATPWAGSNGMKVLAITGDAVSEAKEQLVELLRKRNKLPSAGFDMEPFEVLRDMIRDGAHPSIGGSPQIAKVYRYMRTQHFAVSWPDSSGTPHAAGRPALSYEKFALPIIDPDAPALHAWRIAAGGANDSHDLGDQSVADE